ncbi:MAG TPA: hypothetical protein VGF63_10400 [Solirubrobacteraceae bacterium]
MDVLAFLVIVAVIVAIATVLSAPLRNRKVDARDARGDRLDELEARKQAKYGEIRDAEMDFKTGKLSQADHTLLDRQLRAEAMEILRAIDREG